MTPFIEVNLWEEFFLGNIWVETGAEGEETSALGNERLRLRRMPGKTGTSWSEIAPEVVTATEDGNSEAES